MPASEQHPEGPTEAEQAFLEFAYRLDRGEAPNFDAFCAERPEIAEELKSLHTAWRQVSGLLVNRRGGFSLARGVERALAGDSEIPADAEGSVYTSGEGVDDTAWQRFVAQLKSRGPGHRRYVFKGEVAQGGMGVIHRVYDQDVRRHLAMKVILGHGGHKKTGATPDVDSRSLGRFLEEAQVTGQLDHPGIVPVHELGVDGNDQVYFTMKLVKGEDLRSVFDRVHDPRDEAWNQTRVLSLMLRVCEAMEYAHDKGVIHRDLKPANIMVGKYGETYVMDWGLARVLGRQDQRDLRIRPVAKQPSTAVRSHRKDAPGATPDSPLITMDGDVVGTPAYMSPEQAYGKLDQIGPQSDIYALGAMLYHLLTGHMPYVPPGSLGHQLAVWNRVQEGPPSPLHQAAPTAPHELAAICDKAMSRSIKDRYGNMEELAIDLRAYLETRVVAAYESGAIAEVRKWAKRNKALAGTAATALVAVLVLSCWALLERQAARKSEQAALANEKAAVREKARVLRLSDIKTLSDLKVRMDHLWPAHPENVGAMEQWLKDAEAVAGNLPAHEKTLAELRSRGVAVVHPREAELSKLRSQATVLAEELLTAEEVEDRAELEQELTAEELRIELLAATIEQEQPHDFPDRQDAWWHETLVSLVAGLTAFSKEQHFDQTVVSMKKRLEFAETIQETSITIFQDDWDKAIASISNPEECPKYDGLVLHEQLGLVPIGRDSWSGLWEFWHVQTGEKPEWDQDGRLVLSDRMGLVLVLIPGGTFWMGAQSKDRGGQNYDPQATRFESDGEGNPVEVTLDAYFLSKYEMTQGQWERFTGNNPSFWFAKFPDSSGPVHPVDQVSWQDCDLQLSRLGLELPTEAQWERACRAGTETPWYTGLEVASLAEHANVKDATFGRMFSELGDVEDFDDGLGPAAAVGSLGANGYGLFDMHGNLWEWCRDAYVSYDLPAGPGDGERRVQGHFAPANRGGGFNSEAVCSASRNGGTPDYRSNNLGLRPSRSLR